MSKPEARYLKFTINLWVPLEPRGTYDAEAINKAMDVLEVVGQARVTDLQLLTKDHERIPNG
jgi:hypothetical protein